MGLVVVLWFVLALVVATAASGRGRYGFGYFLLALIISPLIAGLIVAVLPDLRTRAMIEDMRQGSGTDSRAIERNIRRNARWR